MFISNGVYLINKKNNVYSSSFPPTRSWGSLRGNRNSSNTGNVSQLQFWMKAVHIPQKSIDLLLFIPERISISYNVSTVRSYFKSMSLYYEQSQFSVSSRRNCLLWGVFAQSHVIVYVQVCLERKENPFHIYTTHWCWRGLSSPSLVFFTSWMMICMVDPPTRKRKDRPP